MRATDPLQAWLDDWLRNAEPGARLPSDQALAAAWGVSHSTVRRLLRACAAAGRLVRIRGKGTFIPRTGPTSPPPVSYRASSVQSIVDWLTEAISAADLKVGDPLPANKIMCARFHVRSATVRQAYARLRQQDLATQVGKYWWVGHPDELARDPAKKAVVLFADRAYDLDRVFDTPELSALITAGETELLRQGYTLHFDYADNLEKQVRAWSRRKSWPHGLIFSGPRVGVLDPPDIDERHQRVASAYRARRRPLPPIVVLTNRAERRIGGVHLFSMSHAGTVVARTLARFLFLKGCRHATYFLGSGKRPEYGVLECARFLAEIDRLNPAFRLRIVARRTVVVRSPARLFDSAPPTVTPSVLERLLTKYRAIPLSTLERNTALVSEFPAEYRNIRAGEALVFVAMADAADALQWCRTQAIDVPDQTQIVSLEHAARFLPRGITSCVPDWQTGGYALAHAIIGDIPLKKTRQGYLPFRARLLERLTTR
ncbi:MAG: GntR family transcriptional regulator [Kiritimatiellae bacterium]|nr:GntR family transcriptional regulator [Kiritimatiellia bacterium]